MSQEINPPQPAITPNRWIASPAGRKWLYAVAVAALAIAGFYKLLPQEALPFWLDLVANILGVAGGATAIVNVPKTPVR